MENNLKNSNKNSNNKNIASTNNINNQNIYNSNNFNSNNISDSVNNNINAFITPIRKSSFDPTSKKLKNLTFKYIEKINIIQVASASILPNDEKILKNNQNDKNVNTSIKSIILPRIHTPSYKNNSHNLRNSNNYGHHVNNHSELQSNFNNKAGIQKNIR